MEKSKIEWFVIILFQETESDSYINQYHSGFQIDPRIRPFKLYLTLVKIRIIYLECRQWVEYGHMHRMCVCWGWVREAVGFE